VKVLTHRPHFIEPATMLEFGGEASSAIEAKGPALTQKNEEPTMMPKADNIEEIEAERTKTLEDISPSAGMTVPKAQKDVAEPPELFQLKCLSHASGAVTHLNRNNPSVP
jgi:hypothetical protein